jgi:hypothetical protein
MTAKCYGFLNILVDTLENALYMYTHIDNHSHLSQIIHKNIL